MAGLSDLTTTNYPSWLTEALTGSTVKGSANPIGGYGFTQDQIKQMQKMGVTVGDLQNMGLGGGGPNVGITPGASQNQLQAATMLKLMLGQQQQPGSAAPGPGPTGASVMNPVQLQPQQPQQAPPQWQQAPLPQQQVVPLQQAPQQVQSGPGQLNPIPIVPIKQYQGGGLVTYNNPPVGFYDAATQAQAAQQAQQRAGSPLLGGTQQAQQATLPPVPATMYSQGNMLYPTGPTGLIQTGNPSSYANATTLGSQLGAAALNMPMVIDLPPSGSPDIKSGVSKVPGTLIGSSVPSVPMGPWLTNPSVFARAAMPQPTATQSTVPTAPAGGMQYASGTPFATPPAAPGYTLGTAMPQTSVPPVQTPWLAQGGMGGGGLPSAWGMPPPAPGPGAGYVPQGFLQAHTSALANAGMALYSHFGGDPNKASPADIVNFHTQLSGAVGQYAAGAKPSAAGVKQASTGGMVPGRGSGDIVPALLEPGEYVIPKEQVAQLVARGALKMQSGGLVQDPDPEPPEARRQALSVQSGNAPSGQSSSSSAQSSSPQIGGGSSLFSGLSQAAQTYGNSFSSSMGGGRMGGGGGFSADTLGNLGDEPLIGSMGLGQGFGGGGGLSSPQAQSALSGIGSGLTQAAQAIASSVKPWQMQQSAIPDPSQLPKYQIPTLQPERVA